MEELSHFEGAAQAKGCGLRRARTGKDKGSGKGKKKCRDRTGQSFVQKQQPDCEDKAEETVSKFKKDSEFDLRWKETANRLGVSSGTLSRKLQDKLEDVTYQKQVVEEWGPFSYEAMQHRDANFVVRKIITSVDCASSVRLVIDHYMFGLEKSRKRIGSQVRRQFAVRFFEALAERVLVWFHDKENYPREFCRYVSGILDTTLCDENEHHEGKPLVEDRWGSDYLLILLKMGLPQHKLRVVELILQALERIICHPHGQKLIEVVQDPALIKEIMPSGASVAMELRSSYDKVERDLRKILSKTHPVGEEDHKKVQTLVKQPVQHWGSNLALTCLKYGLPQQVFIAEVILQNLDHKRFHLHPPELVKELQGLLKTAPSGANIAMKLQSSYDKVKHDLHETLISEMHLFREEDHEKVQKLVQQPLHCWGVVNEVAKELQSLRKERGTYEPVLDTSQG